MLASPELSVLGDDEAVCRIVNVGTTLITVKIQLLAQTTVVSEENEKVPPGSSAIVTGSGFTSGGMYCRFTGTFNKALVRASIDLVNADTFRTIVIAPAN
jgi:hypothetical protein